MDFTTLLAELDQLNLPPDGYAITSSGTLAVRNLREANDLDLIVCDSLWQQLCQIYPVTTDNDFQTIIIGNIQILGTGSWFTDPQFDSPGKQIKNADLINGHRFVKLETKDDQS